MVSHQALEHLHLHRIVHRDVKDRPGGGWGDGVESPGHQKCLAGEKELFVPPEYDSNMPCCDLDQLFCKGREHHAVGRSGQDAALAY